jgi:hypothetical protein
MSAISSFRSVIALWDSPEELAEDIGAEAPAVRKWLQRDRIPADWWKSILTTRRAKSAGVTAERLIALAAREPAEARA